MNSVSVWEAIFMLLVLKIPLVYLCAVVWWAIRAEPVPGAEDGRGDAPVPLPLSPCGWDDWKRRRSMRAWMRPGRRPIRPAPLVTRS